MSNRFFLSREKAFQVKNMNQRVVRRKLKNGRSMYILRRKRSNDRRKPNRNLRTRVKRQRK